MTATFDVMLDEAGRIIAEIPAAVALFDRELRYVAASPLWVEAFGLAGANATGRRHDELCTLGRAALMQAQRRALAGEAVDACPIAANDSRWPALLAARSHRDRNGALAGVVLTLRQSGRPDAEKAVAALPDVASGMADRSHFVQRLNEVVGAPDQAAAGLLVASINIENLRALTNLHGTAAVDLAVKIVGERLASGIRSASVDEASPSRRRSDFVATLGAGQFGLLFAPPAPSVGDAQTLMDRLLRRVQNPVAIGGRMLRMDASAGFLLMPASHDDADGVLRDVDVALQRAQALGPGKAVAWEPALTRAATWRYSLAEELRRGFENGEFALHYQPVLQLRDNRMVGAEVLLRWNHPRDGLAASATFVPVLEETGLIVEVGAWVVREAVRQLESWRLLYGRDVVDWLSINLSGRQLADSSLLLATLRAIHAGSFPVHRLMLEVNEGALTRDPDGARAVLNEFHDLGIRCAIDDFGTGGGSLGSLSSCPFSTVKFDARLIGQIGTVSGDRVIETLLDLARMHGVAVIAKGVETSAQRDFLRNARCAFGQGHHFAEPMDGALLGAYALTHAVAAEPNRSRRITEMIRPTSAGHSPAA